MELNSATWDGLHVLQSGFHQAWSLRMAHAAA